MMTDPIADMLTRIRNAVRVERSHVDLPYSNIKKGIADVLKSEGYIWDWEVIEAQPCNTLRLTLKYGQNGEKVIRHIKRLSWPPHLQLLLGTQTGFERIGNYRHQQLKRRCQRSRCPSKEHWRRSFV